jgi:ABC-2 type transport system ATP-binding protein
VASGTARELKKLVPSGLVELTFHDEQQLHAAARILETHYKVEPTGNLTLTISVGEGTQQLAELFLQLRDAHIEPAEFSQKVPTLDDVFFKIIGNKTEDQ